MRIKLFIFVYSFFLVSVYGQNVLSDEEKIFGLSTVWSEAKYNFANFDLTKNNWDSAYMAFIPVVLNTKTPEEYYKELSRMISLLHDGHSNVYYKPNFSKKYVHLMKTELIEDKVIVVKLYNDTLKAKIDVGDEIVEVNKMPVKEYASKYIEPYQSASTYQNMITNVYTYRFLLGTPDDADVELKIRKKNDKYITIPLSYKLSSNYKKQNYDLKITDDNIAHLVVNSFYDPNYKEIFDSLYIKILPTKALIIDVRNNGGGNSDQGFYILSHLIDKNTYSSKSKTRQNIAAYKAWGENKDWFEFSPDTISPIEGKERYSKPVIVLQSRKTYSAAEDFLVAFDVAQRGIKVGQPTSGSTGQPLIFDLLEDGLVAICTKRDTYPDGKEFVGIGISPDIEVVTTVQSIRDQDDLTLNKAIEMINKTGGF